MQSDLVHAGQKCFLFVEKYKILAGLVPTNLSLSTHVKKTSIEKLE